MKQRQKDTQDNSKSWENRNCAIESLNHIPFSVTNYSKRICQYGKSCYRKNPIHFQEFTHPHREFSVKLNLFIFNLFLISSEQHFIKGQRFRQ